MFSFTLESQSGITEHKPTKDVYVYLRYAEGATYCGKLSNWNIKEHSFLFLFANVLFSGSCLSHELLASFQSENLETTHFLLLDFFWPNCSTSLRVANFLLHSCLPVTSSKTGTLQRIAPFFSFNFILAGDLTCCCVANIFLRS